MTLLDFSEKEAFRKCRATCRKHVKSALSVTKQKLWSVRVFKKITLDQDHKKKNRKIRSPSVALWHGENCAIFCAPCLLGPQPPNSDSWGAMFRDVVKSDIS